MKTFRLHKVATLVAALALASAGIAGDALAHGGGWRGVEAAAAALAAAVVVAWEAAVATAVAALAAVV